MSFNDVYKTACTMTKHSRSRRRCLFLSMLFSPHVFSQWNWCIREKSRANIARVKPGIFPSWSKTLIDIRDNRDSVIIHQILNLILQLRNPQKSHRTLDHAPKFRHHECLGDLRSGRPNRTRWTGRAWRAGTRITMRLENEAKQWNLFSIFESCSRVS